MVRPVNESTVAGSSLPSRTALLRPENDRAPPNIKIEQNNILRPYPIRIFVDLEYTVAMYMTRASTAAASAVLDPLRIKKTNPRNAQAKNIARHLLSTSAAAT